jgi:hypothetical protein
VTDPISPAGPPAEISHLVRERTEARARRDWTRADALKVQIEAAGWRLVDRGNRTSVSPASPPSLEVGGEVRYGSAAAVPSLVDAPASTAWTVVVLASEEPGRTSRFLAALREHAPAETQVVIVANDPSNAQAAALAADAPDRAPIAGNAPELLRTSTRLGYAAALNIGLRRCAGEFVLLADATARPIGDALTPLAAALGDATTAAAGGFGLISPEEGPLRPPALEREDAVPGPVGAEPSPATALEGAWLAFRRSDYIALGPLDEHFVTPSWLDVWWTLRLRAGEEPEGAEYEEPAEGEGEEPESAAASVTDAPAPEVAAAAPAAPQADESDEDEVEMPAPRRALRLELPLERDEVAWPPDRSRLNRRNMYRVLDRFGWRDDLA